MDSFAIVIAGIVSIIIGILIVGMIEYNMRDWKSASISKGGNIYIPTKSGVQNLRFRNAKFGIRLPDGSGQSINVTGNLNAMASAYKDYEKAPLAFQLVGPLDAFSFKIPGFNDKPQSADATKWASANTTLSLEYSEV